MPPEKAHLLRWRPRLQAQRRETTPRLQPSGAAEVIEPPTSGDRVTFGSTVRLEDETGKESRYQIVGSDETDPARGRISVMAPLARTLIGKKVGDTVTAQLPGGKKTFEILAANFPMDGTA